MHGPDGQLLSNALVTLAAGFSEVCRIDRRAGITRPKNIVHAMARRTVGGRERAFAHGQAVEAVCVGRQAIRRQIIEPGHARIAVASSTRLRGNICCIQGGGGIARRQNQVLTVAIRAVGRIAYTGFQRFAVYAFIELPRDFLVALRASCSDIPMAHG